MLDRLYCCVPKLRLAAAVFIGAMSAFAAPIAALANHIEMSERAASRLSRYEQVTEDLKCLPVGRYEIKKFIPIDNNHIVFFAKGARIFIGDTQDDVECRGLKNSRGFYLGTADEGAVCQGDIIYGFTGGKPTANICAFLRFREVRLKPNGK